MAKSSRNRSRRSKRSRSKRSRSKRSRSKRSRSGKKRQSGGFAAVLKEAIVPIAFLSGNVKLKKKFFNNKTIMIPIFKNLREAKLDRDKRRTKGKKKRRRRKKSKGRKRR